LKENIYYCPKKVNYNFKIYIFLSMRFKLILQEHQNVFFSV